MLEKIKKAMICNSIFYFVIGVIMLLIPGSISNIICYLVGSTILFYGITNGISYFKIKGDNFFSKILLLIALCCIIFGLFMIISPKIFASAIPFTAGVFMFISSLSKFKEGIALKNCNFKKWKMVLLFGFELLIFSIILMCNPFEAIEVAIRFIGLMLIISSLSDLWTVIFYGKSLK